MDYISECGRENGISPDPIGLAAEFKYHWMHTEERKRMAKILW